MRLFVFAHYGEASAFFDRWQYSPAPFSVNGLFKSDNGYILISGEGHWRALEKTSAVLGGISSINEVWNLGVAGALRPEIEKGRVYPIRTFYALSPQSYPEIEFSTYSSPFSRSHWDCVSSPLRILNKKEASWADQWAPLVDREGWAVGRSAGLFKLPFYPVKLAVDRPGEDICLDVKDTAPLWSEQLFDWFDRYQPIKQTPGPESPPEEWAGLYLTASMKRNFSALIKTLFARGLSTGKIKALVDFDAIQSTSLSPKLKTQKLIERLSNLAYPLREKIKKEFDQQTMPLKEAGFEVSFDPRFEKEEISIKGTIKDRSNLEKFKKGLDEFSHTSFFNSLKKDIHV